MNDSRSQGRTADRLRVAIWHHLPSGGGKRALHDHVRGLVERRHTLEAWCPPTADRSFLALSGLVPEHELPLGPLHVSAFTRWIARQTSADVRPLAGFTPCRPTLIDLPSPFTSVHSMSCWPGRVDGSSPPWWRGTCGSRVFSICRSPAEPCTKRCQSCHGSPKSPFSRQRGARRGSVISWAVRRGSSLFAYRHERNCETSVRSTWCLSAPGLAVKACSGRTVSMRRSAIWASTRIAF